MKKRLFGLVLIFCIVLTIVPMIPIAADDITVGDLTVAGNDLSEGTDYTYDSNVLTIKSAKAVTISGTTTVDRIAVAKDVSANITLAGVNIDVSSGDNSCAFLITKDSTGSVTLTLADGTTNILKSGRNRAGLEKEGTSGSLTIRCAHSGESGHICAPATCGALEASSYTSDNVGLPVAGAGIGGGTNPAGTSYGAAVANITISGGNVAASSRGGAGIGSGLASDSGAVSNITISGGNVAASSNTGAGIGSGRCIGMDSGAVSGITISGGCVTASGTDGVGIGSGLSPSSSGAVSSIAISGGSLKASSTYDCGIGKGGVYSDPNEAIPVTPTDGKGNELTLKTIANVGGAAVMIDGVVYPSAHNYYDFGNSEWKTETNVYAYLTDEGDHTIYLGTTKTVGSTTTTLDDSAMAFTVTDESGNAAVHGKDYIYDNNTLTIVTGRALTVKNKVTTATTDRIAVAKDVSANITLAGVHIDVSSGDENCAFLITKDSTGSVTLTLADSTTNILKSGINRAGLEKEGTNGSLTIRCAHSGESGHICAPATCGALEASSQDGGGIGSGYGFGYSGAVSNITISGGNVTASSTYGGSGIGSGYGYGYSGAVSNITISGGNVTASSTYGGGIGSGYGYGCSGAVSNITISGGNVTASSTYGGSGIGSGFDDDGGGVVSNIVISGGSVKASGKTAIGKSNGTAVLPTDGKGNNVYLYAIDNPEGKPVTIGGVAYPPKHIYHNGTAWTSESKLYPYFPDDGSVQIITVGDTTIKLFFTGSGFTTEVVAELLDTNGNRVNEYVSIALAVKDAQDGYTIKLIDNVTISDTVEIEKELTLDLNGYVLKKDDSGSAINIASGAELTLIDSDPTKPHKFTPNADGLWVLDEENGTKTVSGGIITGGNAENGGGVYNKATFTMNGGSIVGCSATDQGGGVANDRENAIFTMTKGTIAGCTAGLHGGGVYNDDMASFTMVNGTISDCTAKSIGGGVYNIGSFTMENGTISGCKVNDPSSFGGGIANCGVFTMNNGTIYGCEAGYGGGVNNMPYATFTMKNGKIEGCKATNSGGGVANAGDIEGQYATFTMNNGTISDCEAAYGGGVYNTLGYFTMEGGSISGCEAVGENAYGGGVYNIEADFTMKGGKIENCSATENGGGVYNIDADFTMKGGSISGCDATYGGGVYQTRGSATMYANGGSIIGDVFHQAAGPTEAFITRSDDATDYTTFIGTVSATHIAPKACPYTVTFNSMGGSAVATQYVLKGQAPKTVADPTREHCTFICWRTEGSSTAYDFSAVLTESVALIADWYCPHPTTVTVGYKPDNHIKQWAGESGVTSCTVCGEVLRENTKIAPSAHRGGNEYASSDTEHWKTCTYYGCDAEVKNTREAHTLDDSGVCTTCGYKKTADYIRCDFDNNEVVDSDDAIYLLRHVFFGEQYPVGQSADLNKDGAVTSDDAIYLLRHVYFPETYPL